MWRVVVMTGDMFEIKGGDMWAVVVEGSGIFDLGAGCEDKKWRRYGPRRARAAAARNGSGVDDFVVS